MARAVAAAEELEDAELADAELVDADVAAAKQAVEAEAEAPASGSKRASPAKAKEEAAAVAKAVAAAEAEGGLEDEEVEASSSSEVESEAEGEEGDVSPSRARPSPSSASKGGKAKKKAPTKKPLSKGVKVDGVGLGAIAAAAAHGTFDLRCGRAALVAYLLSLVRLRSDGCLVAAACLCGWGAVDMLQHCCRGVSRLGFGSRQPQLLEEPWVSMLLLACCSKLATWKAGEPVPFSFLADTFDAIAETTKVCGAVLPSGMLFQALLHHRSSR